MLGIIGAAAGAASGVLGGIGKNKAIKKQMKMVREQQKANEDWYNTRYNEDATQRADAQSMLTQTMQMMRDRSRNAAATAAVAGGTDEAAAAERAAAADAMAKTASNIVVNGERRKDSIESEYRAKDAAYNEQLRELEGQKKSALDMAGDAVGGAAEGFFAGMGA